MTEVDSLHMIIEEFAAPEVLVRAEEMLGRALSLHEVIEVQVGTVSQPLPVAVEWVLELVTVRPAFHDLAEQDRPVIESR